jgi:hypothetical protein
LTATIFVGNFAQIRLAHIVARIFVSALCLVSNLSELHPLPPTRNANMQG